MMILIDISDLIRINFKKIHLFLYNTQTHNLIIILDSPNEFRTIIKRFIYIAIL